MIFSVISHLVWRVIRPPASSRFAIEFLDYRNRRLPGFGRFKFIEAIPMGRNPQTFRTPPLLSYRWGPSRPGFPDPWSMRPTQRGGILTISAEFFAISVPHVARRRFPHRKSEGRAFPHNIFKYCARLISVVNHRGALISAISVDMGPPMANLTVTT